jgi:hypothetical protein
MSSFTSTAAEERQTFEILEKIKMGKLFSALLAVG